MPKFLVKVEETRKCTRWCAVEADYADDVAEHISANDCEELSLEVDRNNDPDDTEIVELREMVEAKPLPADIVIYLAKVRSVRVFEDLYFVRSDGQDACIEECVISGSYLQELPATEATETLSRELVEATAYTLSVNLADGHEDDDEDWTEDTEDADGEGADA